MGVHRFSFIKLAWLSTILLLATGCGLAEIQIAPIVTPTVAPTVTSAPTVTPTPPPPIVGESAAGLVARSEPDDSEVVVMEVASPHLVYATEGVVIEMFRQWAPPAEYLLIDTGLGLRLRVNWSALWLVDSYGTGKIELDVQMQSPDEEAYQSIQYASTEDFEGWGSDHRNQLLDTTLYLPESGDYSLRAYIRVTATDANGNPYTAEEVYETMVIAVYSPPKILITPEDFMPQFADLEANNILLDWRGWRFGPCLTRTDDTPDAARQFDEACVAFANDDWGGTFQALEGALDAAGDNLMLANRIRQQLGTLAAAMRQWEVAQRYFREALVAARAQDDALEVTIALRNLGIALKNYGFEQGNQDMLDEADLYLWQSIHLSDQLQDYLGAALTWGQFGYYWESVDTLNWVANSMSENGMQQAEYVRSWADQFGGS
jgi:tetratricopeptide (TPR) repeat protein